MTILKEKLSVVQWKEIVVNLFMLGVYLVVLIFTFLSIVKHIILNHITAINYRCVCKKKRVSYTFPFATVFVGLL